MRVVRGLWLPSSVNLSKPRFDIGSFQDTGKEDWQELILNKIYRFNYYFLKWSQKIKGKAVIRLDNNHCLEIRCK